MKELLGWAARDKDGELYIYSVKPGKYMHTFETDDSNCMRLPDDCLPEVKWSDEEATKVKITIERCK